MTPRDAPRTGLLIAAMAGIVVVGFPMIYVLWDAVNHLFSGDIGRVRWPLVLPVLLLFIVYVSVLARIVGRWDRPPGPLR